MAGDVPIWLERLQDYERQGFAEVAGKKSNPKILKWAHGVGKAEYMTDDSTTPWCGIGLAGVLEECGLPDVVPDGPAAAISWLRCGEPCEPKVGAIAVFPRTGGNHVTVIARIEGDTWYCCGCNQRDSICTEPFRGSQARGTVWPIKTKTAGEMTADSRIAAAAARQRRDQVVSGGSGSTIPMTPAPASEAVPAPIPAHIHSSIDNLFGDLTWAKGIAESTVDLATFIGSRWWFIAGGVALYFFLRSYWDSHQIQLWRTQDHNEGRTPA